LNYVILLDAVGPWVMIELRSLDFSNTKRENGVKRCKNCSKLCDVIYVRPLNNFSLKKIIKVFKMFLSSSFLSLVKVSFDVLSFVPPKWDVNVTAVHVVKVLFLFFSRGPVVNFINILQTAFAPIFFSQKSQSQTVKEKSSLHLSMKRFCIKFWWNWRLMCACMKERGDNEKRERESKRVIEWVESE